MSFYADIDQLRNVQRIPARAEAVTDRAFAEIEREQDAFELACARAEDEVTFNEVLKRLRSVKPGRKVALMSCMKNDPAHFRWLLENMFRDAFADQCNRRTRRELSQPRHVDLQDEA